MGTIAFFQVQHIWEGCPRVLPLHLQPAPFCNINPVLINVSSAFYLISPHCRLLTFELGIMKNRCVYSTHPYTFPRFGTSQEALMFSQPSDSLASQHFRSSGVLQRVLMNLVRGPAFPSQRASARCLRIPGQEEPSLTSGAQRC